MNGKTQNKYTSVKIHNCQARMTEKMVSWYSLAYQSWLNFNVCSSITYFQQFKKKKKKKNSPLIKVIKSNTKQTITSLANVKV